MADSEQNPVQAPPQSHDQSDPEWEAYMEAVERRVRATGADPFEWYPEQPPLTGEELDAGLRALEAHLKYSSTIASPHIPSAREASPFLNPLAHVPATNDGTNQTASLDVEPEHDAALEAFLTENADPAFLHGYSTNNPTLPPDALGRRQTTNADIGQRAYAEGEEYFDDFLENADSAFSYEHSTIDPTLLTDALGRRQTTSVDIDQLAYAEEEQLEDFLGVGRESLQDVPATDAEHDSFLKTMFEPFGTVAKLDHQRTDAHNPFDLGVYAGGKEHFDDLLEVGREFFLHIPATDAEHNPFMETMFEPFGTIAEPDHQRTDAHNPFDLGVSEDDNIVLGLGNAENWETTGVGRSSRPSMVPTASEEVITSSGNAGLGPVAAQSSSYATRRQGEPQSDYFRREGHLIYPRGYDVPLPKQYAKLSPNEWTWRGQQKTKECGVISRAGEYGNKPPVSNEVATAARPCRCSRCGRYWPGRSNTNLMKHFVTCVKNYGNPNGLCWDDDPSCCWTRRTVLFVPSKKHMTDGENLCPTVVPVVGPGRRLRSASGQAAITPLASQRRRREPATEPTVTDPVAKRRRTNVPEVDLTHE